MKRLLGLLCVIFFFLPTTATVQGAEPQPYFQTNFQNLSNWETVYNGPNEQQLAPCRDSSGLTQWQMYEHGFGAEIQNGQPCYMAMIRPALPFGPEWLEVTWESYFTDPGQDRNVLLHWKDHENWIGIHVVDTWLHLQGTFHGEQFVANNSPGHFPFQANRTYSFRVRENRHNGNFQIWVNSVLVMETKMTPALFIPARPGIAISVGDLSKTSESYFSNFTIWNSRVPLNLRTWKQSADPWADLEYDSAKKWSPSAASIARWGCAMTSAAMILDSVGVRQLPSGEPLNPGTLNAWLKSERDGYIGSGFLNWRAITRLAKWHSAQYGSTSLEFSAHKPSDETKTSWLKDKLHQRIPVILEQPGHFIVATNWNSSGQDVEILDPAYSRNTLAEYQATFLSARVFKPSATNLQGATLLLPKWATPTLWTTSGLFVEIIALEDAPFDLEGSSQTEWQLWDVAPWGEEDLTLRIDSPLPAPLLGAIYNEEGTTFALPALIQPNTSTPLNDSETIGEPEIMNDQAIAKLMSWEEIKTPAVWVWRQQILRGRHAANSTEAAHYAWLLEQSKQNDWLTEVGWQILTAEIPALFSP